jgi:hypothetical protein
MRQTRLGLDCYLRCAECSSLAAHLEVAPDEEIEELPIASNLAKFEQGSAAECGGVDHFSVGVVADD